MARAIALFRPELREVMELWYEFEEPHVVAHGKFASAFGDIATPLDEAIGETLAWFRANPAS
jgi:hypothetical protein